MSGRSLYDQRELKSRPHSNFSPVIVDIKENLKVNVRKDPDLLSEVISVVMHGETVERDMSLETDGFSRVRLKNGLYGWMMSRFLREF